MRIITGLSITALAIAASSAPAVAKGHSQPADQAQDFGQKVAHESYVVSEDANGKEAGEDKGVDGKEISGSNFDRGADTVTKPTTPR